MYTFFLSRRATEAEVQQTLDRWYFAVHADGRLWICPNDDIVDFRDLAMLLKRLVRVVPRTSLIRVELDLERATVVGAGRSTTQALLFEVGRRLGPRCLIRAPSVN